MGNLIRRITENNEKERIKAIGKQYQLYMSQFNQVQGTPLFMADLQAKQPTFETNNKGLRGRILANLDFLKKKFTFLNKIVDFAYPNITAELN